MVGAGLTDTPRTISCAALVSRPVPRWVQAEDCHLDLEHAFIVYEGNTAIAYVPIRAEPQHRHEADVVLISTDEALVRRVLDERRPRFSGPQMLQGARRSISIDGDALRALQVKYNGLARHTGYILHNQEPDKTLASIASIASFLFLTVSVPAMLWRRARARP
ncbi:MAG: hypothetical protein ACI8S6_000271 [Myxococcota bacterium]